MAAKKKEIAKVEKVDPKKESPKVKKVDPKQEIEEKIRGLVKSRNECLEYNEYARIAEIDTNIEKLVGDYAALAETDCFNILKKSENPMVEAAKVMTFRMIRVKEIKEKEGENKGKPTTIVEFADKGIDPLRLHNKTPDGIGADKMWMYKVERLNMLFTAQSARELNKDPQKIKNTIAMNEESRKISLAGEDDPQTDEVLLTNVQTVLTAMLGDGYKATPDMVAFLKRVHSKGGRDNVSVVCSTHKGMRGYMLGVCHRAVTGEEFDLVYKEKKQR